MPALPGELSVVEAALEVVKQIGFPIFVAGWFMLRTDTRLEKLTDAVNRLAHHQEDQ